MNILLLFLFVLAVIGLIVYILHIKDVYYGYGRAVALIFKSGAVVNYDQHKTLTFKFKDGGSEVYIGHLGNAVTNLLLKNKIIDKSSFLESKEFKNEK